MAPHVHAQDSTHLYNSEVTPTPEKKKGFTDGQKKFLAAIAITACLGGIIGGNIVSRLNKADKIIDPSRPAVTDTVNPGATEKQPAIPDEAKNFVAKWGNRYSDPVSTYYAAIGYEVAHPNAPVLVSDSYVSEYEMQKYPSGETSDLGFSMTKLSLDKEIGQATSIEVFNNYTVNNLNLYMNLIAKNPDQKAMEVIDNQFLNYCAGNYFDDKNTSNAEAKADGINLLRTAKAIALKYGSSANYNVAPASNDDNAPDATIFGRIATTHSRVDGQGKNIGFSDSGVTLVIDVDSYDGSKMSRFVEVIKDVQLSVERQQVFSTQGTSENPIYTSSEYISIGQVSHTVK